MSGPQGRNADFSLMWIAVDTANDSGSDSSASPAPERTHLRQCDIKGGGQSRSCPDQSLPTNRSGCYVQGSSAPKKRCMQKRRPRPSGALWTLRLRSIRRIACSFRPRRVLSRVVLRLRTSTARCLVRCSLYSSTLPYIEPRCVEETMRPSPSGEWLLTLLVEFGCSRRTLRTH